ncbi:MAG TPA: hypothetical protein ENI22_01245 [Candidatus Pacearchaeota archaeon]|nr:hypothetical protein [Candidatus Pacearchaeota archaeon]
MARKKQKKTKKEQKVKKATKKEQIRSENKILRNFLIGVGILIATIFLIMFIFNSINNFEYKGVNFETVREGQLTLYKTSLPVIYKGQKTDYNFYLRNDPRELKEITFQRELNLRDNLVINSTEDFNCQGDGIIAIANLINLYKISGINVLKDENATCDVSGRYMFVRLQSGNETSIEKFGPACYNININNCEILEGTERFMIESFVEINKLV